MQSSATTVEQYVNELPEERKEPINKLREVITNNLPPGFVEQMSYGGVGYVIPHSIYPKGYHCDTKLPLPFLSIVSQKNFIALYHFGIYMHQPTYDWFVEEYPKHSKRKLDIGKSCIRFKKIDEIPYDLIGALMTKITVQDMITEYEKSLLLNKTKK